MKFLAFSVLSLMALALPSAYAQKESGHILLELREKSFNSNWLTLDISRQGNFIEGRTFFGRSGMVHLQVGGGIYQGIAGGNSPTQVRCANNQCSGIIAGRSADFATSIHQENGKEVIEAKGTLNFHQFILKQADGVIYIHSGGTFKAKKVGDGLYGKADENGITFFRHFYPYEITHFVTSGTLKDFSDPVLLAIFVGTPLTSL